MLDLYRRAFLRIPVYCGDVVKSAFPKTGTFEVDGFFYTHTYKDSLLWELVLADSVFSEQISEMYFYQEIPKNLNIHIFGNGTSIGIQLDKYQNGFYDFVDTIKEINKGLSDYRLSIAKSNATSYYNVSCKRDMVIL